MATEHRSSDEEDHDHTCGINGFGRIGRDLLRNVIDRGDSGIEVVAVNDVMPAAGMAHLLRYDSTYGTWQHQVLMDTDTMHVDDAAVRVTSEQEPANLRWDEVGAEDAQGRRGQRLVGL